MKRRPVFIGPNRPTQDVTDPLLAEGPLPLVARPLDDFARGQVSSEALPATVIAGEKQVPAASPGNHVGGDQAGSRAPRFP